MTNKIVGCFVIKNDFILVHRRGNIKHPYLISGPGGSVEYSETEKDALNRELSEESLGGNIVKLNWVPFSISTKGSYYYTIVDETLEIKGPDAKHSFEVDINYQFDEFGDNKEYIPGTGHAWIRLSEILKPKYSKLLLPSFLRLIFLLNYSLEKNNMLKNNKKMLDFLFGKSKKRKSKRSKKSKSKIPAKIRNLARKYKIKITTSSGRYKKLSIIKKAINAKIKKIKKMKALLAKKRRKAAAAAKRRRTVTRKRSTTKKYTKKYTKKPKVKRSYKPRSTPSYIPQRLSQPYSYSYSMHDSIPQRQPQPYFYSDRQAQPSKYNTDEDYSTEPIYTIPHSSEGLDKSQRYTVSLDFVFKRTNKKSTDRNPTQQELSDYMEGEATPFLKRYDEFIISIITEHNWEELVVDGNYSNGHLEFQILKIPGSTAASLYKDIATDSLDDGIHEGPPGSAGVYPDSRMQELGVINFTNLRVN